VIDALKDVFAASPVPLVFDHFGTAQGALGATQPGFDSLLALVKSGKAYVKLSGAYRNSTQGPDYPDMAPLAKALIDANPRRMLWGSDWPHPESSGRGEKTPEGLSVPIRVDDAAVLNQLAVWAPTAPLRRMILVENPAALYGW
jgi:predicted TIM-barrel fold metal-dependent hydrolase